MFAFLLILIPANYWTALPSNVSVAQQQVWQKLSDLSFGERQVEQFNCDRPSTAKVIQRNKVLHLTLIWYFAGELKGNRVHWDCGEPLGGQWAEHSFAAPGYPVLIRVSNKESGVDQCAGLLFELLNSDVDGEYELLLAATVNSRKSRDDFAKSCVLHEFRATKKTQLFFSQHPLIGADFKNDWYYFSLLLFRVDFSDYLRLLNELDDKAYNPLKYYGRAYDQMISSSK